MIELYDRIRRFLTGRKKQQTKGGLSGSYGTTQNEESQDGPAQHETHSGRDEHTTRLERYIGFARCVHTFLLSQSEKSTSLCFFNDLLLPIFFIHF